MSNTRYAGATAGTPKAPAHSDADPAPEANLATDAINIGLPVFQTGIKRYATAEQEALEWLWGYSFDVLGGSKIELERETGFDYNYIYRAFTGQLAAGTIGVIVDTVEMLKRQHAKTMPLVETPTTRLIIQALDYARDWRKMVTIQGPTGRGKTYTSRWWATQNNHGRTRMVRARSSGGRRALVTQLCAACGIGVNGKKTPDLESRLHKAFTPRSVIIVDEAGFLLPRSGSRSDAMELLRDLHDDRGCAVVMIFTDVYLDEIVNGRNADYYEQFIGRIMYRVKIAPEIEPGEIAAVVKSFHPTPSADLVRVAAEIATARDGKLRTLFEDLTRAREYAARQGHELTAKDLTIASKWRTQGVM